MILSNLKVLKLNNYSVLKTLAASEIMMPISYVFFLNEFGRYVADCFIANYCGDVCLISTANVLNNLFKIIKKYDLRQQFSYDETSLKVFYSVDKGLKDPRGLMNILISDQELQPDDDSYYLNLKMQNLIAEFDDFVFEKSILFEYGEAWKFVNRNACYLGQEAWNHLERLDIKNRLLVTKDIINAKQVLFKYDDRFLIKDNV